MKKNAMMSRTRRGSRAMTLSAVRRQRASYVKRLGTDMVPSWERALMGPSTQQKVTADKRMTMWKQQIATAARQNGMTYNEFMSGIRMLGLDKDRRKVAEVAMRKPGLFTMWVQDIRGLDMV